MKPSVTIAVMLVICSAVLVRAQEPPSAWNIPDFSASQVYVTPNLLPASVSFSGSMLRVERERMVTLFALSSSKAYTVTTYPDGSRSCVIMDPKDAHMIVPSPLAFLYYPNQKFTSGGKEIVEGHPSQIKEGEVTGPDGLIKLKVWLAEDLNGMPIKVESQLPAGVNFNVAFREIKLATPDKQLLTLPVKCIPYEHMWQDAGAVTPQKK